MTERGDANAIRGLVIGLFVFGAVGVGVELVLLEHFEELWQWVPLTLIGVGVPQAITLSFRQPPALVRTFRTTMVLFVIGSAVGLTQHFRGNVEFELEMYPSRGGVELVWEALKGATPSLAPGTMALLGLLGLTFTFRHPALVASRSPNTKEDDA